MPRLTAPAADPPLLDAERLFAPLAGGHGLVLAVSGGPDSTALMALVAGWQARPPCLVVSVDHGLRPGSADETRLVAANAACLGLPVRVMRAPERARGGNLQDWARRARYSCLAQAAREAGFDAIVTAHHLDDQAETFLMRTARGSGVYGLAAMAEEGRAEAIRLVRPLLAVPRSVLSSLAAASGLAVIEDPSNADPRFQRVRVRALMPELSRHGLTSERLAATARRLRRAAAALDHYAAALLRDGFRADAFGTVAGRVEALAGAPEEVGLRALALILKAVGGADYSPPLERTENLLAAILAQSDEAALRRTLHGAVVAVDTGRLTVCREWGRGGIAPAAAPAGATSVWDGRFRVRIPEAPDLAIGPLGRSQRRLRSNAVDRAALRTLPGLFRADALIAVPDEIFALDDDPPLDRLRADCLVGQRLELPGAPPITA